MNKILYLTLFGIALTSPLQAGWFSSTPDPIPEYKDKIIKLESDIKTLHQTLDHWQIIAGSLGVACALLFIVGTALGAKTRKHYDGIRNVGLRSAVNGRKSAVMATNNEEFFDSPLAA